MRTKVIIFACSMLVMLSIASCLKTPDEPDENEIILPDNSVAFNTNTQNIVVKNAVSITFSGGQTIVDNPFEGYGVTITVDKQNVTINSTVLETELEVNYVLSGITFAGFVKIYSDNRFGLLLNGVSIQNPTGAAINIQSGRRVTVTLVDHTSNRLVDEGKYHTTEGEDMKGTFFSERQLIFDGNGSLLIYGNYGHAICVDNYIRINSGNITVNNAAKDGIHCNEYFQMEGGNLNILRAKSDGVECEKGYVAMNGGAIKVNNTDGSGIKSAENTVISGGRIEIESRDNGINAEGNILVTGGEIYCNSDKNGMGSKKAIAILGGLIVSSATKSAFECDSKMFAITEGGAVGVGNATTIPTAGECRQWAVVWGASGFTAGQLVSIKSSGNSEVLTFKLPRAYFGSMALVYTSPLLQANTSYTIYKGGSVSGGSDFHGLYSGAVSSGGTTAATFTTSTMVTTVGNVTTR